MPKRGHGQVQKKRHRASILSRRRSSTTQRMRQSTIKLEKTDSGSNMLANMRQEFESMFPSPEDESSTSTSKPPNTRHSICVPRPGVDETDSCRRHSASSLPLPFPKQDSQDRESGYGSQNTSQAVDSENIPPLPLALQSDPRIPSIQRREFVFRGYYPDLHDISDDTKNPLRTAGGESIVFTIMRNKELLYHDASNVLGKHPIMTEHMRAIVLDWMCEVSEAYRLHRETYFLGVDIMDRYLQNTQDIHKAKLQLIAVTALFAAAKIEEIYPPKLTDFAFVTDGACSERQICRMELVIMNTLKWDLNPVLLPSWVKLYLKCAQRLHPNNTAQDSGCFDQDDHIELDINVPRLFCVIMKLLDLAIMHTDLLRFKHSQLAAAAFSIYCRTDIDLLACTGYDKCEIASVVEAMVPVLETVNLLPPVQDVILQGKSASQSRCYQVHQITHETYEQCRMVREALSHEAVQITPERHSVLVVQPQPAADVSADLYVIHPEHSNLHPDNVSADHLPHNVQMTPTHDIIIEELGRGAVVDIDTSLDTSS